MRCLYYYSDNRDIELMTHGRAVSKAKLALKAEGFSKVEIKSILDKCVVDYHRESIAEQEGAL